MEFWDIQTLDEILTNCMAATNTTAAFIDMQENVIAGNADFSDDCFTYEAPVTANEEQLGVVIVGSEEQSQEAVMAAARLLSNSISLLAVNALTGQDVSSDSILKEKISHIVDLVQEINEKSLQLDKIESKQKILSLNASIEAARSGEFGRGFAVVANEVGKSAANSEEINKSIKKSLKELTAAIQEIEAATMNTSEII